MSLFGALFSGVSGLAAQSQAMGIIADNITNVSTTAFKRTTSNFSSLVTGSRTASSFAPGGVQPAVRQLVAVQGLLEISNSPTDLAINGDGFFVVSDVSKPTATAGQFAFTRAGSFSPDKNGDLRNAAGFFLRGYEVTDGAKGTITSDRTNLLSTATVNITDFNGTAQKTTSVKIQANLQSTQAISAQEAIYLPTVSVTNMASGNVTPDFSRSVQIFDSQGATRTLTFAFLKDAAAANQWNTEIFMEPSTDITPAGAFVDGQVSTGLTKFNTDGSINVAGTTVTLTNVSIPFGGTTGLGVTTPQTVTISFGTTGKTDGLTQFAGGSELVGTSVDGALFGKLNNVEIGELGVVTANFSNGLQEDVFKLPIATFPNPNGLASRNGSAFLASNDSGDFTLQLAGESGAGKVAPSALEASSVDLAEEFTDMIVTQRAFSAAGKIITTTEDMLDELVRLKR